MESANTGLARILKRCEEKMRKLGIPVENAELVDTSPIFNHPGTGKKLRAGDLNLIWGVWRVSKDSSLFQVRLFPEPGSDLDDEDSDDEEGKHDYQLELDPPTPDGTWVFLPVDALPAGVINVNENNPDFFENVVIARWLPTIAAKFNKYKK